MHGKLDQTQRNIIGEKFIELGNLTVVALVFGQFLNDKIVPLALIFGLMAYIGLSQIAVLIMRGGDNK